MISLVTILFAATVFIALLYRKYTRHETVDLPSLMHVMLAVLAFHPLINCLYCLATGGIVTDQPESRQLLQVGLLLVAYLMFESVRRAFDSKNPKD